MAKPAMKAAQPAPDDDEDEGMDAGAAGGAGEGDEADEDQDEGDEQGTVIATIVDRHDGTFCLYHGPAPESEDTEEEPEEGGGADESDEGQPPAGEEGEENEPEQGEAEGGEMGEEEETPKEEFDDPGKLLKAVLDLLNKAEADNGSGEHAFSAGFNESKEPTPKY